MSELASSISARRPHPCEHCGKSFSSTHQLAQHSRVHTGEKPYKCSYCDRKFKQLSHVQQHTRLHTGERPYKCSAPNCGRAFIQLSNLQQHMKTHSSIDKIAKNAEKRFFCNNCGKGFKGQGSMITHQSKKHSEVLNSMELFLGKDSRSLIKYNCQLCGKTYQNEGSYTKHMEAHEGSHASSAASSSSDNVQLLHCGICPSVFSSEFALLSHMEQMRSEPKHLEAQLILSCAAADKKQNAESINALATNLSALVANGISNSDSQEVTISGNMLAQNLLQLNQHSSMDDSSLSPTNDCINGDEQNDLSDFRVDSKVSSCKYYSKITENSI